VAHNHPSGNLEASQADKEVTARLKQAGEMLGITLTDHLIVSAKSYFSIRN
jgi:DNA repair protein RadC